MIFFKGGQVINWLQLVIVISFRGRRNQLRYPLLFSFFSRSDHISKISTFLFSIFTRDPGQPA